MDTKILGQHAARERDNHRTVLAAAIDLAANEIDNLRARLAAVEAERDRLRGLVEWAVRSMESFDPRVQTKASLVANSAGIRAAIPSPAAPGGGQDE